MTKTLAVALTVLGFAAFAGGALACEGPTAQSTKQQTVMTDSATPSQTPMPTKPGG